MAKKYSDFQRDIFWCMALLFASSSSYAEMYKWVDADGKTHYSDKRQDAGKTKVEKLKINAPQPEFAPSLPSWQDQELERKKRQEQTLIEQKASSREVSKKNRAWGGSQVETDATRCALARDVLSGAARHVNGVTTDVYDRELAQNDIRNFCH